MIWPLNKDNFFRVMKEIEEEESFDHNIWISVGLLELLMNDNRGWIDYYFHIPRENRNIEELWIKLNSSFGLNAH